MFDVMVITHKGMALLASSTAQDKLIIDGCDADATVLDATNAGAVVNRPANPISTTTNVTLLAANSTSIFTRATFLAGQSSGGDVNTFYLYGHLQSAANDKFVVAVVSDSDSVHLPDQGDLINSYGCEFEIQYSHVNDTVQVVGTANYANLAEFNVLKERTVTTHKEGDNTVGDNQHILGAKYFEDRVEFNYSGNGNGVFIDCRMQCEGKANFTDTATFDDIGDNDHWVNELYVTDSWVESVTFSNDVTFGVVSGNLVIGDTTNRIYNSYATNMTTRNLLPLRVDGDSTPAVLGGSQNLWDYGYIKNVVTPQITFPGSLKFKSEEVTVGNDTVDRLTLGASDNKIYQIYADSITSTGISTGALTTSTISTGGYVTITNGGVLQLYGNIEGSSDPVDADNILVGASFESIGQNAGRLHFTALGGLLSSTNIELSTYTTNTANKAVLDATPSYESNTVNVPVGAIIAARLKGNFSASTSKNAGETLAISASTVEVASLSKDGWGIAITKYIPAGNYVLLNGVTFSGSSSDNIQPVFLKRIADTV